MRVSSVVDKIINKGESIGCRLTGMPGFVCDYGVVASALTAFGALELIRARSREDRIVGYICIGGGYWVHTYSVGRGMRAVDETVADELVDTFTENYVPAADAEFTKGTLKALIDSRGGGISGLLFRKRPEPKGSCKVVKSTSAQDRKDTQTQQYQQGKYAIVEDDQWAPAAIQIAKRVAGEFAMVEDPKHLMSQAEKYKRGEYAMVEDDQWAPQVTGDN